MPETPFTFAHEIYPDDWFRELSPAELFPGREGPIEVDLGCGDGSFLTAMGKEFGGVNFLGVERLLGRCRKVSRKATQAGLENVRVMRIDTNYAVRYLLSRRTFRRIHFLCPDPWPKKKHASRRQMCQVGFLDALRELLVDDGELLFKTDSEEYFAESLEVLAGYEGFRAETWDESAFFYPRTDFETQWLGEGRQIHRLRLIRAVEPG